VGQSDDDDDDDSSTDDFSGSGIWYWLLHGKSHPKSRRALLVGVSLGYLAAAAVFALAALSPLVWPCMAARRK